MIMRNVLWVEFSLNEFVSLMMILVMTKHPAAIYLESESIGGETSGAGNCPSSQHHTPCLRAGAESTTNEENEDGRLHHNMTAKYVSDLAVHGKKCSVRKNVSISNPRLITQLIELRCNVYTIRTDSLNRIVRGSAVATIAKINITFRRDRYLYRELPEREERRERYRE